MSIASIEVIINRIKTAPEDSKIAVFKCKEYGKLNAVFDSTYVTQSRIKIDKDYIGSFCRDDDIKKVLAFRLDSV